MVQSIMLSTEPPSFWRRLFLLALRWRIKLRHSIEASPTAQQPSPAPAPFWERSSFWGTFGVFLALGLAAMAFGLAGETLFSGWLFLAAWPFAALAAWCALPAVRPRVIRFVCSLGVSLAVAAALLKCDQWLENRHEQELLNITVNAWLTVPTPPKMSSKQRKHVVELQTELAPLVLIKRHQYKVGGQDVRGTDYGFIAVLRIRNDGPTTQFVRKLEIYGDVAADCVRYEREFGEEGHQLGYLDQECEDRMPFHRLRLDAYPLEGARVESGGDEQFIRFVFLQPSNIVRYQSADPKKYFGFHRGNVSPQLLTTAPYLWDLVTFTRVSPDHFNQVGGFKLRPEIQKGEVKFKVTVGSTEMEISPKRVRQVRDVFPPSWEEATSQDLFYGTDGIWNMSNPVPVH